MTGPVRPQAPLRPAALPRAASAAQATGPLKTPLTPTDRLRLQGPPAEPAAAPARSAAEARRDAEELWCGQVRAGGGEDWRRIERDPGDVNATQRPAKPGQRGEFGGAQLDAQLLQAMLQANQPLVDEALSRLGPVARAQYAQVASQTAQQPHAALALQLLLIEGKLTGGPAAQDGQELLGSLARLATGKLAKGIDRPALVSEVLRELALPSAINQHGKGTCTVTVLQMLMARQDPSEYVRLVAGLASPAGLVRMRNGEELARVAGTETDDHSRRATSARLWQAALMEYANGTHVSYDNASDRHSDTGETGLFDFQVDRAIDALTGENVALFNRQRHDLPVMLDAIQEALARGQQVPVAVAWGASNSGRTDGLHELLLTRIEGDRAFYQNPWGSEESMPLAELEARLQFASVPGATEPARPPRPPKPPREPKKHLDKERYNELELRNDFREFDPLKHDPDYRKNLAKEQV